MKKVWTESAPANIALIKYMGKIPGQGNRPTNASLSYTLEHLRSYVQLEAIDGEVDQWQALPAIDGKHLVTLELSEKSKQRFLQHLTSVRQGMSASTQAFLVRSGNDFPSDCGLASSASSFAALTKAAVRAICELREIKLPSIHTLSELSRQGSGSSCRSFFSPWSVWRDDGAREVPELSHLTNLHHMVVVVEEEKKFVSSSEAHRRVTSSLLFNGRVDRAEFRLRELLQALQLGDWSTATEVTWAEFWDMHALFETSRPSFGYMTARSIEVLRMVRAELWRNGLGPLVTMDAGANIHLLFNDDSLGRDSFASAQRMFATNDLRVIVSTM